MSKTREQLAVAGILLAGPIVPSFFKITSDGASVPTGFMRKVLDADQTRAAGFIHDYGYYLGNICFVPGTLDYKRARYQADVDLKFNRTKIGKGFVRGQVFGRIYFRGVRFPFIGGARAMRKKHGKLERPPSLASLELVRGHCVDLCKPHGLSKYAKKQLKQWEKQIKEESR